MNKISNEEILGFGSLILGVGMFTGIMMSNNQNYDLKELVKRGWIVFVIVAIIAVITN